PPDAREWPGGRRAVGRAVERPQLADDFRERCSWHWHVLKLRSDERRDQLHRWTFNGGGRGRKTRVPRQQIAYGDRAASLEEIVQQHFLAGRHPRRQPRDDTVAAFQQAGVAPPR